MCLRALCDVMIAISSNFFYTVTLPCSLWFFDKGKQSMHCHSELDSESLTRARDTVLFIDARNIFTQVTRAVRDFSSEQLNFIANIVRLYRGEAIDNTYLENHPTPASSSPSGRGGGEGFAEYDITQQFPKGYQDIAGLCKIATIKEIEQQGWSLNPGRYVGVTHVEEDSDEDFAAKLTALQEELEVLNNEAHELEQVIGENVKKILE